MLIAIGDLMDRVDILEAKLEIDKNPQSNEQGIMQITCPHCGKQYDMDYPKCPYCGHTI